MMQQFPDGVFYNADCFDVMRELPDASVDMVLTDVPYNAINRKSGGLRNLDKGIADSSSFDMEKLVAQISRVCLGSVYVFCAREQIGRLGLLLESAGFTARTGVWSKTNPSPMNGQKLWLSGLELCVFGRKPKAVFNEHCKSAIWTFPTQRSKIHDTQKPIKLFKHLVEVSSDRGQTVLDCFAGSGTTAIAAMRTGRRWICIEKDETYYQAAVERVAQEQAQILAEILD